MSNEFVVNIISIYKFDYMFNTFELKRVNVGFINSRFLFFFRYYDIGINRYTFTANNKYLPKEGSINI